MHPTRCSFDSGSRRRLGAFTLAAVAGLAATAPLALAAESASLSESARSALTLDAAETYSQPADPAAAPAAAAPAPADPDSFFKGWTGSLEAGMSGASGNSENFGFRVGLGLKRDTSKMLTTFTTSYTYASQEGDKTENRGDAMLRNDWKFGADNRWRFFALGKAEYDDFKDYDWRLSAFVGVGYELIKTDTTLFVPRIGVGITREIGGSSNEIVPELDLGWDFEHKFNQNVKFFNTFDFYPSLKKITDYRIETKAGLEVLLSEENKLALKIGVEDKYDSTPEGLKRNDLTYFAVVSWNF